MKAHIKNWVFEASGWKILDKDGTYNLTEIDEEKYKDSMFYKERWMNENGLSQRIIVTFSIKYRNYQRAIRENQVDLAQRALEKNPAKTNKKRSTDYKRFIYNTAVTKDGEIAEKNIFGLDSERITKEAEYDGFYAVCTDLEDPVNKIIQVNKKRWEIEECFRIIKHEFKARPVYLSRDNRIKAHFLTCFISLLMFRLLEKKLNYQFTCNEILETLREMNFNKVKEYGYIPNYQKNEITDSLHEKFGFRTDFEIVTPDQMKKICVKTKREKVEKK